ncbi:MAG: divalent-cation tolerance protein CutA [Myxococcota bacterium]|nr:divalent-cation tolerance protein CutA [Myxococcota bacterium]
MSPSDETTDAGGGVRVVLVTAPERVARELARALVGERLAACVNLVPGVRSIYRWQGEIEEDEEVLLVAKTQHDRVAALSQRVRELHPYDLPETLALSAAGGSAAYLAWVCAEST